MKKRISILCAILLLLSLMACQSGKATGVGNEKTGGMNLPVPGLSWGMTVTEVKTVLHEQYGIEDSDIAEGTVRGGIAYSVPTERMKLESVQVLGLPITTQEYISFTFRVYGDYSNFEPMRLDGISLFVHAESGPKLCEKLTAAYGEPVEVLYGTFWPSVPVTEKATDEDIAKLNDVDRTAYLDVTNGDGSLWFLRPYVTVRGAVEIAFPDDAMAYEGEEDFLIYYDATHYMASRLGSVDPTLTYGGVPHSVVSAP